MISDLQQAADWAQRTARRRGNGYPCLSAYEVDNAIFDTLRALHSIALAWSGFGK